MFDYKHVLKHAINFRKLLVKLLSFTENRTLAEKLVR